MVITAKIFKTKNNQYWLRCLMPEIVYKTVVGFYLLLFFFTVNQSYSLFMATFFVFFSMETEEEKKNKNENKTNEDENQ